MEKMLKYRTRECVDSENKKLNIIIKLFYTSSLLGQGLDEQKS